MAKYTPKTKEELRYLVENESIYLGDIDTSNITDMYQLFEKVERRDFSGIDSWDTSKVVDMSCMFVNAKSFNENINSWDTSSVVNMASMFGNAEKFNQPLNSWDTSNVVNMSGMFKEAESFNQPLDSWDTSNVVNMGGMFMGAKSFNQNIDSWNVSNVKVNVMWGKDMFDGSSMKSLPIWHSIKKMDYYEELKITNTSISKSIVKFIEKDAQSNKYVPKTGNELYFLCYNKAISLGDIDTSNIVDMSYLFKDNDRRDYSGIESWDTSKVISMFDMFCNKKSFNEPLGSWDTSSVEFMTGMFEDAESFNQNIDSWDVSSVRDNQRMFWGSGMNKLPKWYKKRAMGKDASLVFYSKIVKKRIVEAVANPRPKKPKIAPQDKPQSNSVNDLISTWFGFDSSKPPSKGKAILSVIVLIAIFAIFRIIDKSEDSQNNNKATTQPTQTTQPKQTQPAQQPTQNTLRCDDRDLLNHIIKSYKDFLVYAFEQDTESFSKMQEDYRQAGINLTSAEELINSFKHNITNVRTKSSDEVNKQIVCEVEVEEIYPIPQYKPYYGIVDYRAQLTNDNSIGFEILDTRTANK